MGLTEDRLSPIVAPQPTYRQRKTHTFQISNMFRKTLAILALVAPFSVACAAPQRDLLQDETATAAPAQTTAPATDEIDTAANTTTTTTEEASASQAAAPEATMPQTGYEWMQAYNPYAQFLGAWYPGAGIEAYEAAMNATAAQFAGRSRSIHAIQNPSDASVEPSVLHAILRWLVSRSRIRVCCQCIDWLSKFFSPYFPNH